MDEIKTWFDLTNLRALDGKSFPNSSVNPSIIPFAPILASSMYLWVVSFSGVVSLSSKSQTFFNKPILLKNAQTIMLSAYLKNGCKF